MFNYKQTLLLTGTMALFASSYTQALKIGNKVPDIKFERVYNYASTSFKLSDFKGKWIIFDFWSTNCASCIKTFPKMDSLQRLFNGKIQIILVNKQSFDTTIKFFQKLKIKKPNLPVIGGDTILSKLFPHQGVPHLVWLNEKGEFYSATSGSNANVSNITKLLKGTAISFKQKNVSKKFASDKPLIASVDSISFNGMIGYSYLIPGNEEFDQTTLRQKINGSKYENRIVITRAPITYLYKTAYNGLGDLYNFDYRYSIILEVKDSSKFIKPKDESLIDNWEQKNLYNYDLLVPSSSAKQIYSIMQQDLNRYFDINASVEKRKIPCLVLTRISDEDKLVTKGGKPYAAHNRSDTAWEFRNQPFKWFVERLRMALSGKNLYTPIIDKTNYQGNVDISLSNGLIDKFSPFDFEGLRNALKKYGLDLVFQEAETDVLVLKDK